MGESVREILRSPPLVAQAIGFSGLVFVLVGYLTWMPTMLAEKFDLSLASAGFQSVAWHHIFGYLGLLMAGAYETAGQPFGPPDESQPMRPKHRPTAAA